MATIDVRKGEDGKTVYRVRIRRKGYSTQTATFNTRSEAKKWIAVTEGAIFEKRHFNIRESTKHTLGDAIERYMREVLPHKSTSSITMQTLELRWWKKKWDSTLLTDITPAMIADARDTLAKGRKNSTVNRYLAALSHTFTIAVREWGWIEDHPVLKVRKLKEPRGRVRFLSDEERALLLNSCKASKNRYLFTIVILALSIGGRKNELMSLQWNDIDFKRGMITFRETKNGETRSVPLTGTPFNIGIAGRAARTSPIDRCFCL